MCKRFFQKNEFFLFTFVAYSLCEPSRIINDQIMFYDKKNF